MKTFDVKILAADRAFYQGECESIILPTTKGQYGILSDHCNLLGAIVPGVLKIKLPGKDYEVASVSSGLFKMEDNQVLVLIDSIERPEEIDLNKAKLKAAEAKEALLHKLSKIEYHTTKAQLARAINRINVKASFDQNLK